MKERWFEVTLTIALNPEELEPLMDRIADAVCGPGEHPTHCPYNYVIGANDVTDELLGEQEEEEE